MANTEPFRLRILKELTAELQKITIANGYSTDVAAVFRGRDTFSHDDPVPMISILESILEKDQLPSPPGGGGLPEAPTSP